MRKTMLLKENFRFNRYPLGETPDGAFLPDFDDADWRVVSIPHDFGIESDFGPDYDCSFDKIVQDGITEPIVRTGRTGGLPIIGTSVKPEEKTEIFAWVDRVIANLK